MITSSVDDTNPAGRLHHILSLAQAVIDRSGQRGEASHLWATVFEIPVHGPPLTGPPLLEVISRLLQLDKLIEETEQSLRRIEDLPDRYFRPFTRIRPIPQQSLVSLQSDISGTIRAISEGDMTVLEFCSERLERQHAEPIINDEELREILEAVTLLFDEVKSSETINAELKAFVLDGLEAIRRGINEFRIRGPERLKEALGEVIGSLAVNRDIVKAGGTEEAVGKFEKLCYRFAAVVSFASDAAGLLTAMKVGLLPGG